MTGPATAVSPGGNAIDSLAAELRKDPVKVDQIFGNGHTAEVEDRLHQLVDQASYPVYVVMTTPPAGLAASDPAADLASRLHTRLGDGLYLVDVGPTSYGHAVKSYGDGVPTVSVVYDVEERMAGGVGGADAGVSQAGTLARDLDVLVTGAGISRKEFDSYSTSQVWRDPPEWSASSPVPPTTGDYVAKGGLAFVLVAGAAFLLLRNAARWRETAPITARAGGRAGRSGKGAVSLTKPGSAEQSSPELRETTRLADPAALRREAESAVTAVAERLARATALEGERRELVDGSYDTARTLLDRLPDQVSDADTADLVGALVLARIADRALDRPGRRRPRLYRPCFFDPRHGEGDATRRVDVADASLDVPACPTCRAAAADDIAPLTVRRGRRARVPYYETDSVWAGTGYGALVDDLWQQVARDLRGRGR